MSRGPNSVDRRRLRPCDYLVDPSAFGRGATRQRIPAGGDEASALIAWLQHRLVSAYRRTPRPPSGAMLGRVFGFSKQTFSRSVLGQRWMGESVQAALLITVSGQLEDYQRQLRQARRAD